MSGGLGDISRSTSFWKMECYIFYFIFWSLFKTSLLIHYILIWCPTFKVNLNHNHIHHIIK